VRRVDTVARFRGEEFAVCMPSIRLSEAASIGEQLRNAVSAEPFDTPAGPTRITVSIGVAEAGQEEHGLSNLIERADRAMYAAKQAGRDRVVTEPEVIEPRLMG
jgi:diguanylate cyclase (GGDEF)-like protein